MVPDRGGCVNLNLLWVKAAGGKTGVIDVRDLRGVLDGETAAMRVRISLHSPTRDMLAEAVSTGSNQHKTIEDLTHCAAGIYTRLSGDSLVVGIIGFDS
jgi:hypothetical protein